MTSLQHSQNSKTTTINGTIKNGEKALYHTVTACVRCRQRKTRCDPGLPRCEPCERSNARCEYFDTTKNCLIPRTYITSLQRKVAQLQKELQDLEKNQVYIPDAELMIRGGASIKFSEYDESRYLGPSSGIAITRLVMELAKQNTSSKSIREVVPDVTAQDIKKTFDDESEKPTSKVYPLISSVPAPNLPSHDLMERLVDLYMVRGQYMLPVLHEPTFRNDVEEVCGGSPDPCKNFQLRMVIANSMQMLDTQYAGLADSYYLAALPFLEGALQQRNVSSLQCLVLIAQYSTLTPTRTASYWIVGIAARLSQELGLCDEETISQAEGIRYNTLEIDMRRRLYWITLSMEYGLAHSLGRPSCFGISVDHVNVNFFEMCDDRFITPEGILPGAQPIMKKCISMHFFRMRLLQAEIRRMLYLRKREYPLSDKDQWFIDMRAKLDRWIATCPKNDEGSGFSEQWFKARLNTMVIFLYRPSPQVPEPSPEAASQCYDAAVENINLHYLQITNKLVPVTWIFTLSLCMVLNTTLWTLSYPSIRQLHPFSEVQRHINAALDGLSQCSDRWPGVLSALQLYRSLIQGCLQAYRSEASYVVHSPSNKPSPSSNNEISSPSAQSPASHTSYELSSFHQSPSPQIGYLLDPAGPVPSSGPIPTPASTSATLSGLSPTSQPLATPVSMYPHQQTSMFQPQRSLPPVMPGLEQWDKQAPFTEPDLTWPILSDDVGQKPWLGSIGDEYSRYMHQSILSTPQQQQTLSQKQQSELMATLESDRIPDVSGMINESRTFYSSSLGNL